MASLNDMVHVMHSHGPVEIGRRVYREVNEDNVFTNAAAMAYAWVFAVFPLVIFLMSLVPYLPTDFRRETPDRIAQFMYNSGMPYAYVGPVQTLAIQLLTETHAGLLSFGLLLTLYAASGGMNTTMSALDAALDIDKSRPFWWKRLIAMGLTIFMGLSFLIVVLMLPVGSLVTALVLQYLGKLPGHVQQWVNESTVVLTTLVRYAIGLTVMQVMIGVLYYVGPSKRERLRFFSPGGLFSALGWLGTGFALRFYFEHSNSYSKTYGAVAGMVVMLMVFYLDATIILIGAELNNEIIKARYEDPPSV